MSRQQRILFPLVVFAVMIFAATGRAALQLGTSGWDWSNPQPQGESLLDVTAADATHGYAAGTTGTLLATADAGETWSSIPTGISGTLSRVSAPASSSLLTTGACIARRSDDGGATLTRLAFTASEASCSSPIAASSFQDATSGLILQSDGTVLATTDGGVSFAKRTSVPGTGFAGSATDLVMTSSTTGLAGTISGALYKTANGGSSWDVVLSSPSRISGITFADGLNGFVVSGPRVYKTIDGGQIWTLAGTPGAFELDRIRCANPNLCLITRVDGGGVVRTGDGGATYASITPASVGIHGVAFFSPTRAVAVGDIGSTVASDDGGATWHPIGRRIATTLSGLRANPGGFAYGWGAGGGLAMTTDRGATWHEAGVPTSSALRSVSFATPEVGYAVDGAGTVLRTANGGATWQILDTGADFKAIDAFAVTPERVLVLGTGGRLIRSTNGGSTFRTAGTPVVHKLATTGQRAGATVVLSGRRGIAVSTNGGASWRVLRNPKAGRATLSLRLAQCTSASVCWAVAANSHLYRTLNAGKSWTDLTTGVGFKVTGLALTNRTSGYVLVQATPPFPFGTPAALRTSDGGKTWSPQLIDRAGLKIAPSSGIDYALDLFGNLFTTTTGGVRGTRSVVTLKASTQAIRRTTRVTISGRLTPAVGGERVVISPSGAPRRFLTVASNGRFSTAFTVGKTTSFVAQWNGDRTRASDGSPAVMVRRR